MSWVKGQTTWANLADKLTKLIVGEVADDSSVTVASGDRWIRDPTSSVADSLYSPLTFNTGLCGMRTGYFACTNPGGLAPVCRLKTILSGTPTGAVNGRWYIGVGVITPNTASGNYSTANLYAQIVSWDASGNVLNGLSFTNAVPNATGDCTFSLGGISVALNVTDPSGLLNTSMRWYRFFTSTYLGGIDHWEMWNRRVGTATFGTAPPGTVGTDYDLVDLMPPTNSGFSNVPSVLGGQFSSYTMGCGLGIKTATGLGAPGALYTTSFDVSEMKLWIPPTTGSNNSPPYVNMYNGRAMLDAAQSGSPARPSVPGYNWLRPFTTAGSILPGSIIQYWMSVKTDHIAIVLNGDPGQTGKLTCNWIFRFDSFDPTYDLVPWAVGNLVDYTLDQGPNADVTGPWDMVGLRRRQDGSEGSRDWQTKWMRDDFTTSTGYQGVANQTFGELLIGGNSQNGVPTTAPDAENKPWPSVAGATTANWWLYGWMYNNGGSGSSGGAANLNDGLHIRGKINKYGLFIPGSGWSSGDELTDSITGKVYFLVQADYHGIGIRQHYNTNQFSGGAAIEEA